MQYLADPAANVSAMLIDICELTGENVLEYTQEHTSGWITAVIDDFSEDYSVFRDNWVDTCRRIADASGHPCTPQKILLVDAVFFQQTSSAEVFLQKLCDKLTEYGYCVRRSMELQQCPVCGWALPVEELYHRIQDSRSPVSLRIPVEYWPVCIDCQED